MSLLDDLKTETDSISRSAWTKRDGTVVPEPQNIGLGNEGAELDATFLYADLADSTKLAIKNREIAAEVYKAYLMGATRIIRDLGGEIRSFDGDRVMGIFITGAKNTDAVEAALKINWFFGNILKPSFEKQYPHSIKGAVDLRQTVGVDTSKILAVRSGSKGNNDLVWIGRAPNVAAKLSGIRTAGYNTYITKSVYDSILDRSKFGGLERKDMWEFYFWLDGAAFDMSSLYRSNWWWTIH